MNAKHKNLTPEEAKEYIELDKWVRSTIQTKGLTEAEKSPEFKRWIELQRKLGENIIRELGYNLNLSAEEEAALSLWPQQKQEEFKQLNFEWWSLIRSIVCPSPLISPKPVKQIEEWANSEHGRRYWKLKSEIKILIERLKKPRLPTLYPQETNLIDLPVWFLSTKGLIGEKLQMEKAEYKPKGEQLSFEFDRKFSLPTMFTFKVAGILQGLWQELGFPDTFLTSHKEVARRLKIPPQGKNLTDIETRL